MATPEKAHEERLTQELFDKARRRLPPDATFAAALRAKHDVSSTHPACGCVH
jgi:hypothetical protein